MLNDKEKEKFETIKKLLNKEITRKEASAILNLSLRQIDRLKIIYNTLGEAGFINGNKGKTNKNKTSDSIIEEIKNMYLKEYYDYNFIQYYEEYVDGKYDISYDVMLKAFTNDDIISPLAHKKTIKLSREKMSSYKLEESEDNKEKIKVIKSRIIQTEKAHTRSSNNLYVFGQEVQMDACEKYWFGGIVTYLHLAVDKATKKVLFGWFEYEEITRGYYVLLLHIIINYGIPAKIKADNRSTFSANNAKNKNNKNFMTQFGKTCERLNIVLTTTSVSTAKANVERENATFKNRLIAELRHEGITTIDEANDYLNNVFIPKMNKKFSYAINKNTSLMRENTYTEEELKLIISERIDKLIDNASSISYKNNYYVPIDLNTGELVNFSKGTKCVLIINYDGDLYAEIENNYYTLLKLENRDSIMTKEALNENNSIEKEHHKYIPPKSHPWRKNMMFDHKI